MTSLLTRLLRFAGLVIEDVVITVLPSDLSFGNGGPELVWCHESGSWSLVKTEVLHVNKGAYAQRGPDEVQ